MYVLGVNVAENPSACLIGSDGRTIATSEWDEPAGMPAQAIEACFDALGVGRDDIDLVVLCGEQVHPNGAPPRRLPAAERAVHAANAPWPEHARIHTIDHHLAHACAAFYPSGFDRAAILVVDRSGAPARECSATGPRRVRASAFRAAGGPPQPVFEIEDRGGDRSASAVAAVAELFAKLSSLDVAGLMDLATRGTRLPLEVTLDPLRLAQRFASPLTAADPACADAARAVGDLLQHVAVDLAIQAIERTGARKLCIAGDAAVHGLERLDPRGHPWIDQLYVPPAPGDVGTAVGAALFGCCAIAGAAPACELETVFHGRPYSDADVISALDAYTGPAHRISRLHSDQVLGRVADLLSSGAVVAWFDGAVQLGEPLDRRCVLASPSRLALAPRIDASLRRPSFRALTAFVLVDDAEDYFEITGPSPFGHRVARVVSDRTREIPLVVRSDGTSRVHTIDNWRAPRLNELLGRLQRRMEPPVLAAAPLRQHGGRAVETPGDAVRWWERSEIDALYLQGHLLIRGADRNGSSDDES